MARPRLQINWDEVDYLLKIQCTLEEVAGFFNCSPDTIERACKREQKMGFAEYSRLKRQAGRASLRRAQWKKALSGNPAMLIWLGKNELGQRDKLLHGSDPEMPLVSEVASLTNDQLAALIVRELERKRDSD